MRDKEGLIEELETLKVKRKWLCSVVGICGNITGGVGVVKVLGQGWPQHSGNPNYPIPGGTEAYLTLPHWEGEQLMYRLSLIDYMIDKLKEEIKEEVNNTHD